MRVRLRNPDREVELSGRRSVRDVLSELAIDPDTVLLIRDRTLFTRKERVAPQDELEIRPVISGGRPAVKCTRCGGDSVVEVRRHNAAFCGDCFVHHVTEQVRRSIRSFRMIAPDDRVLVAVSGGKDSLALWDVLLELGYRADELYLGLGIGEYSDASGDKVRAFAEDRRAELVEVDLREEYGFDVPTAGRRGSRSTCAVCGLSKRYVFNGRRSGADTTSSPRGTTSTTRPPRCSGTRSGGIPNTSPASPRSCRTATAW
jgi:sulfur carrier protein ThiS